MPDPTPTRDAVRAAVAEAQLTAALGVDPQGHTEHGAPIYPVPSWQLANILGDIPDRHLLAITVNEVNERRIAAEHRFVLAAARVCPTPTYDALVAELQRLDAAEGRHL